MRLEPARVESYLAERLRQPVEVVALVPLDDSAVTTQAAGGGPPRALKTFGYGRPVLISYRAGGEQRRVVLQTAASNPFGHEYRADRAASVLASFDTFNTLPQHVPALDVGVLLPDGGLRSIEDGGEFYLLTEYVEGEPYARDLQRLRDSGDLSPMDVRRAESLAAYLAEIHTVKSSNPALYRRHIRDLLGSGEEIMGLTDSYPPDFDLVDAEWLEEVEHAGVHWRWRLKERTGRLSQIHGDFHPFNVLFGAGTDFRLLDRSRGGWGEPGDDVSCMAINYLFFSLQRSGLLEPPFSELWDAFWSTYLSESGDREILTVVGPFFAWRALVLGSPIWYDLADDVRRPLFHFVENVLSAPVFDPEHVNSYL